MNMQQLGCLWVAALIVLIGSALAPVKLLAQDGGIQGTRIIQAMGVIEQSPSEGALTVTKGGPEIGYAESFKRFITQHEFWKPKLGNLERNEPPVWKQDHIMGLVRDRPGRVRTGPELGTFYDANGALRLYKPSPPPRGRTVIVGRDGVDWFKFLPRKQLSWVEEKEKALKALPPKHRNDIIAEIDREMKDFHASKEIYRSVRQITRAATRAKAAASPPEAQPVFSPDCEFDDAVLARVTDRLIKETDDPSRLASLTAHFKGQEEILSLRNCICRVHAGKSSTVSVFYQNEPHGGSPSCKDPANGPCVGAGFGCGRSKFVPDRAALEACGAARVISKAVCEKQARVLKRAGKGTP